MIYSAPSAAKSSRVSTPAVRLCSARTRYVLSFPLLYYIHISLYICLCIDIIYIKDRSSVDTNDIQTCV